MQDVLALYIKYAQQHFPETSVFVFDGYPDNASTKSVERLRRQMKHAALEIEFDLKTKVLYPKEKFLSNEKK